MNSHMTTPLLLLAYLPSLSLSSYKILSPNHSFPLSSLFMIIIPIPLYILSSPLSLSPSPTLSLASFHHPSLLLPLYLNIYFSLRSPSPLPTSSLQYPPTADESTSGAMISTLVASFDDSTCGSSSSRQSLIACQRCLPALLEWLGGHASSTLNLLDCCLRQSTNNYWLVKVYKCIL